MRIVLPKGWTTIPPLAKQLEVGVDKIHDLIESGDLVAVNFAGPDAHRPRWKIFQADLDAFLDGRASRRPAPKSSRRKPATAGVGVTEYYPRT